MALNKTIRKRQNNQIITKTKPIFFKQVYEPTELPVAIWQISILESLSWQAANNLVVRMFAATGVRKVHLENEQNCNL